MSRSFRKTPIAGIATAVSDKAAKTIGHRQARAAERGAMARGEDPPSPKAHGNPWSAPKDGKRWYGYGWPELMRK